MKRPQYSPCCHRIIGCQSCVSRWFAHHTLCPHCSTPGQLSNYSDLRGVEELLDYLRPLVRKSVGHGPNDLNDAQAASRHDKSSDDDFELPAVNLGSSNTA